MLTSSTPAAQAAFSASRPPIPTAGRAAISRFTPTTKGAANSRARALPREASLRPAIATTSALSISLRFACSRKSLAMTPPPRRPTRMSAALHFLLEQPLAHLLYVDDEPLVRAARDRVGAVVDGGFESDAPAVDVRELDGDRDFGPE